MRAVISIDGRGDKRCSAMGYYITTVRGKLIKDDPEAAKELHNGIVGRLRTKLEPMGGTSHMVFANTADPTEFLAVDRWESLEGMQAGLGDPATQQEMSSMFDGAPQITVWAVRDGWTAY
jgi:quinol monooxygenase YgiN